MLFVESLLNELSIGNLFIRPNILMWNRPEVFVFTTEKRIFILESGSGGIYGHAHGLAQLKNPRKLHKGALLYFTIDREFFHSHPDVAHEYYIAKTGSGYAIFDSETGNPVNRTSFDAGHYHGLKIRDVFKLQKK
jgi:hypothetical protein